MDIHTHAHTHISSHIYHQVIKTACILINKMKGNTPYLKKKSLNKVSRVNSYYWEGDNFIIIILATDQLSDLPKTPQRISKDRNEHRILFLSIQHCSFWFIQFITGQARIAQQFSFKKCKRENQAKGEKAYHADSDTSFREIGRASVRILIDLYTK